ncbi:hypothetical protein Salat_1430000 [Sesamum alatum]|uniref:Uncharacterized protein n=1 Tax=Sesamum alatum TaxID=300844 RepID=A0AAE1YBI6_9LAMI|nr:hypothetical protein Salat_1430000 [Sesamum alatum]
MDSLLIGPSKVDSVLGIWGFVEEVVDASDMNDGLLGAGTQADLVAQRSFVANVDDKGETSTPRDSSVNALVSELIKLVRTNTIPSDPVTTNFANFVHHDEEFVALDTVLSDMHIPYYPNFPSNHSSIFDSPTVPTSPVPPDSPTPPLPVPAQIHQNPLTTLLGRFGGTRAMSESDVEGVVDASDMNDGLLGAGTQADLVAKG